ncbi:MAG: hypothetical protein OXC30_05150 [Alphaproteobacteria bacterium]|nr:hypothetical protein [Alphaproteobacteria bacterium]
MLNVYEVKIGMAQFLSDPIRIPWKEYMEGRHNALKLTQVSSEDKSDEGFITAMARSGVGSAGSFNCFNQGEEEEYVPVFGCATPEDTGCSALTKGIIKTEIEDCLWRGKKRPSQQVQFLQRRYDIKGQSCGTKNEAQRLYYRLVRDVH